jgi:hypothetical protein
MAQFGEQTLHTAAHHHRAIRLATVDQGVVAMDGEDRHASGVPLSRSFCCKKTRVMEFALFSQIVAAQSLA